MVKRSVRKESVRTIRLEPGINGRLDTHEHESVRPADSFVTSENARMDNALSRRPGRELVTEFNTVIDGSADFSDIGDPYAFFSPPVIPQGGFFYALAFTAVWPTSGTASILSSVVVGKAFGPVAITIDSTGVIDFVWYDIAETKHVVTSGVIADGATVLSLSVYDPKAGTFTVYFKGVSIGSETGLASNLQPMAQGPDYFFSTDTDGAGAPAVGTHFGGILDAWHLGALRGIDISAGLLAELLNWSLTEWRNPGSRMTLSCFDFNDIVLTPGTIVDRSDFQNNATPIGLVAGATQLVFSASCGNKVERVQGPAGRVDNTIMVGGKMFYETIKGAS